MSRNIFLFLLVLLPAYGICQTKDIIKGRMVNTQKEALEAVSLMAYCGDTLLNESLTTEDGQFTLALRKGKCTLRGTYFGQLIFEKELDVNGNLDLGVIKVSPTIQLKEMVVEGKKKIFKQVEDKLEFNVQDLSHIEGYKAIDVLKYAPKVLIDAEGGIAVGNRPATVFLNGRQLSKDESASYLQNINAKDISRIEIQAMRSDDKAADIRGGIINIITKSPPTGFNGTIFTYDSYPRSGYYQLNPGFNLNYGTDKWNIYTSYAYNKGRNLQYSETTNAFLNTGMSYFLSSNYVGYQNQHSYNVGSTFSINKNHLLGLEFNGISNVPANSNSAGQIQLTENGNYIDNAESRTKYLFHSDFYNMAASYTWKMDSLNSSLKLLLNYNNKSSYSSNLLNTAYIVSPERSILEQNTTNVGSDNYSFKADFRKNFTSHWTFKSGIQYLSSKRQSDLAVDYFNNQDPYSTRWNYNEKIASGYAGLSRNIGDKFFVFASLRLEHTDAKGISDEYKEDLNWNYTDLFPYIFFSHKITEKLSYHLLYTKTIFRPPFALLNNYSNRVSDFIYDVGNPYLKPEKEHVGEFALDYGPHSFSLSFGYTPNAITEQFVPKDSVTYHTNANFGSVKTVSVDYSFNDKLFKWWETNFYAFGGYTYIPQSYNRTHLFNGFFTSNNRFLLNRLGDIQLNFNMNPQRIVGSTYLKWNYGVDISYGYSFFKNALNMQLGVTDIFNSKKVISNTYVPNLDYSFYAKSLSRAIWIRLTYNFASKKQISNQKVKNDNTIINRL